MNNQTTLSDAVTSVLEAGWTIRLFKNQMGSYTATAKRQGANRAILTDHFTPAEAVNAIAEKVSQTYIVED